MQRKIRIVQITANLGIGGLERVVTNLCKHINKDMFDISVCCLKFKGEFASELEKLGISVHSLADHYKSADYTVFLRLKDYLQKKSPDLIHTHNINSFVEGAVASFLARIPVLINTDHARKFPGRLTERLLEAVCARKADRFVAVSEETKQNLMRYEWIPEEKISIIANGIDGSDYDIDIDAELKKAELNLSGYEHIVGLGVRLTQQKGISHLIDAAPIILESFPGTGFLIAGKGPLREHLYEHARRNGVIDHFHFIGPRLDLAEILQVLDVYVLPSEWEGLPLVILEAMAAGLPIVATNVGGNCAAIDHDYSGLLVEPKNAGALANAVCQMLHDDEMRIRFGNNAKQKFNKNFSVQRMVDEYESLYLDILRMKKLVYIN